MPTYVHGISTKHLFIQLPSHTFTPRYVTLAIWSATVASGVAGADAAVRLRSDGPAPAPAPVPVPVPDTVDSGSETETEGTETETEGTEPRLVETHAACVPEPVRTPAAQLLRCAAFFPELAGPAAPSPSPPASPRGTPPEKSAGCQCLPRCLTRLCRQRAAAAPQPDSAAQPGMAWRARLPQSAPDQRAQGDAPPTYRDVYR